MNDEHNNLFSLTGKVALVTGASRGLGRAIALGLANAGATVICCASKKGGTDETEALIKQAGGNSYGLAADLSDETAVNKLYQDAVAIAGKIDILVNNGGTISRFPAHEYPMDEFRKVIDVNLNGLFQLSQLAGKDMLARKAGKIINIASMLSFQGGLRVPSYTSSKSGVKGMTMSLANELAKHNINVNAIAPGYMATDNTAQLRSDEKRNSEILGRIPAERWGEPSDLGGAVVFLASNAANYINGHTLAVDGGWLGR